jgi:predicted permease
MGPFLQTLTGALRPWRRYPLSNLAAVAILAGGIGASATSFSLVGALLLRPLPYAEFRELVHLYRTEPASGRNEECFSLSDYGGLRDGTEGVPEVGAYALAAHGAGTGEAEPVRLAAAAVTENLFPLLGVQPVAGRRFEAGEDPHRVAVLSRDLAERWYGSAEAAVGQRFLLDGVGYEAVGVMPRAFVFPAAGVQLWYPLPAGSVDGDPGPWAGRPLQLVARLSPGVSRAAAERQLGALFERIQREGGGGAAHGLRVVPLREALVFSHRRARQLLVPGATTTFLVLLLACAHVAVLSASRAIQRGREVPLRSALGAGRWHIFRHSMTEALGLTLAGGAAGAGLAWFLVRWLRHAIPGGLFRGGDVSMGGATLGFTLVVTLVATLLTGLGPALHGTRRRSAEVLRAGAGVPGRRHARRLHGALVAGQVAAATLLLMSAALLARSFPRLERGDPGFAPAGLLALEVHLPAPVDGEVDAVEEAQRQLVDTLEAVPGVAGVTLTSPLPFDFETTPLMLLVPDGASGREVGPEVRVHHVTPGFFSTLRIERRRGRYLTAEDRKGTPPVAVVNEALARRAFGTVEAVDRELRLGPGGPAVRVVGVVADTKNRVLYENAPAILYLPQAQHPQRRSSLLVRTGMKPLWMLHDIREAIRRFDPRLPVTRIRSMDQVVEASLIPLHRFYRLLRGLAAAALALAGFGLYSLAAYEVAVAHREIGVRKALGARSGDALGRVLGRTLRLAAVGLAAGLLLALGGGWLLAGKLPWLSTFDGLVYGAVAVVILATAAAAGYLPTRRAARVDPAVTLRAD